MGTHAQIKKCKEFLSLNDLEFLPTKFPPPKSPILLHKRIYSKKLCRQGFGREGLEEAFELKGRFSGECWTGTSQSSHRSCEPLRAISTEGQPQKL